MEKGVLVWFTGVAASGKTTVARALEKVMRDRGLKVENLDADEVRANLSPDLGYTPRDRDFNTKRLAYMGKVLARNGVSAIVAAVSPLRQYRDRARGMVDQFVEVYVKCPIEVCRERDPKGLYKRADRGEINDIAGLHQPYEEPDKPEVVLNTDKEDVEACVKKLLLTMETLGYIPKAETKGSSKPYTDEEEEKVKERLRGLGYIE
ncbi:MAG: adenylyl-sulfate kinase [Candidatus Eisenbacteria bacterium]